MIEFSDQLSQR